MSHIKRSRSVAQQVEQADHSQEEAAVDLIDVMRLSDGQRDPDECDDPDCACREDAGHPRPGDGVAKVTMTEVYDPDSAY